MAKPRLEKVEALFYVLKQVAKGGCIRILIHPPTVGMMQNIVGVFACEANFFLTFVG